MVRAEEPRALARGPQSEDFLLHQRIGEYTNVGTCQVTAKHFTFFKSSYLHWFGSKDRGFPLQAFVPVTSSALLMDEGTGQQALTRG